MKASAQFEIFPHVSLQEKVLFTKHLSVMLKAGIPLTEGLEILIAQTRSQSFKRMLEQSYKSLKNGKSLGQSLSQSGKAFNHFYISIIDVGEESGTLEQSLEFLADQLRKEYYLKKKVQGALLYPGIVMSAIVVMGSFIAFFILPQLVGFFGSFNIELPLATKILLGIAKFFQSWGIASAIGLVIFTIAWSFFVRTSHGKPFWHWLLLHVPVLGTIIKDTELVQLCRNLGVLLKSGVPIVRSLETAENTLTNLHFQRALAHVLQEAKKGKSVAEGLQDNKHYQFPLIVIKMIEVGEKTGKLDESLLYLGDYYEEEIDNLAKNLSTILEPILLIIIGLVVAFIALAVISPIYELTGSIRR